MLRHQQQPVPVPVTSDGLRRLQLALEAQITAAGAAGVTTFNGRSGVVTLLASDLTGLTSGFLPISIVDLPLADPAEPLVRWELLGGLTFTGGSGTAAIA